MSSKDRVLDFLEKNKEDYISGEFMAESLGLSRTAVWKAIKELRNQGYVIEASSKKGYILGTSNDIISESGIIAELSTYSGNGASGKKEKIYNAILSAEGMIHIHETLDSTNKAAKELAIAGATGGTFSSSSSFSPISFSASEARISLIRSMLREAAEFSGREAYHSM